MRRRRPRATKHVVAEFRLRESPVYAVCFDRDALVGEEKALAFSLIDRPRGCEGLAEGFVGRGINDDDGEKRPGKRSHVRRLFSSTVAMAMSRASSPSCAVRFQRSLRRPNVSVTVARADSGTVAR